MCEAVNQKAIADAVAQKLQREGQQIVREVGTADVKQDFLVSFVDLSVDTINPSAQLVETDIFSGRSVIRLFLKIALRQFTRGQIIPAADFVGSRAAVAEKLKNRERQQQKNDGWMDTSNQPCVEEQTEKGRKNCDIIAEHSFHSDPVAGNGIGGFFNELQRRLLGQNGVVHPHEMAEQTAHKKAGPEFGILPGVP